MEQKSEFSLVKAENQERINQIETFKNAPISVKAQKVTTGVVVVGGVVMASVFAMQIISGVAALVTLGVVGGAGYYATKVIKQADPFIQQKIKNKILEKMYEEASENAIMQLANQVIQNSAKLSDARKARDKMGAMVENLKSKVAKASEGNKPRMKKSLEKISLAYESVKTNTEVAQKSFSIFEKKVEDYKEMDKFNKEAGAVLALFEKNGGDKLSEMLSLEAFDSIENDFNTALISIENSAHDANLDAA